MRKDVSSDVEKDNTQLLLILADIREKSGVGQKPMLTELGDAIAQSIDMPFQVIRILREQERKLMHEAEAKMLHFAQEEDGVQTSFWSTKASRHQHAFSILNSAENGLLIGRIPASKGPTP